MGVVVQTIENSQCLSRVEPACIPIQTGVTCIATPFTCGSRSLESGARDQPTPKRRKRSGGEPTSSLGCPNPGRINLFHRLGVGGSPKV